jgi:aerobic carbon-monoxide dehydrogenase medium subunit
MKPAPFDYLAPTTLDEAVAGLAEFGPDAKALAGGQSLLPILAMRLSRFSHLIDLNRVRELDFISSGDGEVVVGAMTREARVGTDPSVARNVPMLAAATRFIGHFQIRNRGTLGGSIAHADPAAEYPAVALALDATMDLAGPAGSRTVTARDFFVGFMTTALADDELLCAVRFPVWGPGSGFGVREFSRRSGDFALAGAMAGVQVTDGVVTRAALCLFGMGLLPHRADALEAELVGSSIGDLDAVAAGKRATAGLKPPSDIHASSSLRLRVGADLAAHALADALEAAR